MPGAPGWVLPAYYAIAAWWMLSAVWNILRATVLSKGGIDFIDGIGIFFSVISALIGLGLLLRVDSVRDVVNFFCFLRIIFGLFGIVQGFLFSGVLGMLGIMIMIASIIDVLTGALMIYLIGETDTSARDI